MAMTPLQSVLWNVKQRIENDKKLSKLRQKVNSGKATYADTASYSTHVGNLLGDTFAQHILSVSPELREALTVELLHDRYMDINAIIDRVQKSMDEAQGLHLAPQHSPFYDDRAHQIGSALADPTVPDETIKRRARAATATATKAMHDDRMKSEAKFRSRAGLKCTVNRIAAAKCCEWCDQVAGKYAYEDTPPDLWRRHDNCNCTIVYGTRRDRQVLRGTEKKWEIVAEGAGAPEPVRLTPEQARKLQEKHQLKRLTKESKPAIMKNIELPPETDQVRSMSAETKHLISNAFDKILAQYDVRIDEIVTEPLTVQEKTVPFQFQPIRGKNGELIKRIVINSQYDFMGSQKGLQARIMRNFNNGVLASNSIEGLVAHELAHVMTFQDIYTYSGYLIENKSVAKRFVGGISIYADSKYDGSECIAEAFAAKICGQPISQEAQLLLDEFIERRRKHG